MVPLLLPAWPFGLVLGVTIVESDISNLAGFLSSTFMFAGAAQLAAISLLGAGAPALSALSAALVVNTRHVMYSAAMVPRYRGQPKWFRRLGPYFLIDQLFALLATNEDPPDEWRSYYLGGGVFAWITWHIAVGAGLVIGPALPQTLDLAFAVPALFLGLLTPSLVRRPALIAAVVAALATAAFWTVPNRGGMLIGSLLGVVAGYLAERKSTS
jgi:4-azaleucine resistance transporter AzlC